MSTEKTLASSKILEIVDDVMVDVQPIHRSLQESEENLETCVIDDAEYECIVDDEESNVGSIVSVQSEEIVYVDDGTMEFIVPEVVEPPEYLEDPDRISDQATQDEQIEDKSLTQHQDSWPTLEILPGGVINTTDKNYFKTTEDNDGYMEPSGMLYACAKCSKSFKYLFSLVKHVKLHKDNEKKKQLDRPKPIKANKYICLTPVQRKIKLKTKGRKVIKKS